MIGVSGTFRQANSHFNPRDREPHHHIAMAIGVETKKPTLLTLDKYKIAVMCRFDYINGCVSTLLVLL